MQVIIISEENHGLQAVAKDYQSALKFLISKKYLHEKTEVWDDDVYSYVLIKDKYGENWENAIRSWSIEEFNDKFYGIYFLYECEVYE